jgi:hypothetical protein
MSANGTSGGGTPFFRGAIPVLLATAVIFDPSVNPSVALRTAEDDGFASARR